MRLDGATRLTLIVGELIAQVKSPAGMTAAFQATGLNALVVSAHVGSADIASMVAGAALLRNLDGVIVTIPHKFTCLELCSHTSARAKLLGAVYTMRRLPDGNWQRDMFDGERLVAAARTRGGAPAGKRALLEGASGAGSAIGLAVLEAGATQLAVHCPDLARRDSLVARLAGTHPSRVVAGSADPAGLDLVLNALPIGMRRMDPVPVAAKALRPEMVVGCVITASAVSPLVVAACGCASSTSTEVQQLMRDFLLHA